MFKEIQENCVPKSIGDIVFSSEDSRELVEDLVSGARQFPITEGKCGILLYGVSGTGKSALAKLLPEEIEKARGGYSAYETYIQIEPDSNGLKVIDRINRQTQHIHIIGSYHYFVLDEVDNLTDNAMKMLKSVMNSLDSIFIMTTNNFHKIEAGVKDRCYCIPFNAAPAESWLPYARRLLSHAGVTGITDVQLIAVLEPCNGSARQIKEAIDSVILKVRRTKLAPKATSAVETLP